MQQEYEQKNRTCNVRGNRNADQLFCMMENLPLSDEVSKKIRNVLFWIVSNHSGHEESIREEIKYIEEYLNFLSIFTDGFKAKIYGHLMFALEYEITQEKEKKGKK